MKWFHKQTKQVFTLEQPNAVWVGSNKFARTNSNGDSVTNWYTCPSCKILFQTSPPTYEMLNGKLVECPDCENK